ncbi:MAG: cyclic nucleotide-binding domain-containing protein [Calditrichia bacterium]
MKSIWANIFKHRNDAEESVTEILGRIPVFQGLSRKEIRSIERILHRRLYKAGELIFKQGDAGVGMYIIEKGVVAIRLEPSEIVVAELADGEFFGELALLDDAPRSASAVAQTDCKILGFFQPDLFGLIERQPRTGVKIVVKLAQIIGERLRAANQENQEMRNQVSELREALKNLKEAEESK